MREYAHSHGYVIFVRTDTYLFVTRPVAPSWQSSRTIRRQARPTGIFSHFVAKRELVSISKEREREGEPASDFLLNKVLEIPAKRLLISINIENVIPYSPARHYIRRNSVIVVARI